MVWIKKASLIVFVLILSVVLVGCVKESIVPDLSEPNATSELSFRECRNKYSWYFEDNPGNNFRINFKKPVPFVNINNLLETDIQVNFDFENENSSSYTYLIFPESSDGLTILCNIVNSTFDTDVLLNTVAISDFIKDADTDTQSEVLLDALSIAFNKTNKYGVTAITSVNRTETKPGGIENTDFKHYFLDRLNNLATEINGIDNITLASWFTISDSASIRILYDSAISKEEREELQNLLRNSLLDEWYVEKVYYVESQKGTNQ